MKPTQTICQTLKKLRFRVDGDEEAIRLVELASVMAVKMQDRLKFYATTLRCAKNSTVVYDEYGRTKFLSKKKYKKYAKVKASEDK